MTITFVPTATVFDVGNLALAGAWGVTFASVGGNPYLYVGGGGEAGISAFAVSATGQLTNVTGSGGNFHGSDIGTFVVDGVAGLTSFSIGGASYLYEAAFTGDAVCGFGLVPGGGMIFSHNDV